MDDMKQLASVALGSLEKFRPSKVQLLLDERIDLTEAISLATKITGSYPAQDKITDSYLGALAHTLASYPASIARQCADLDQGVARHCKFLPSVAEIVNYCETRTEPLRRHVDWDALARKQIEDRAKLDPQLRPLRENRLTIDELKEKYGDWNDHWRLPGTKAREDYEQARAALVAQIGEDAFNALPDGPQPAGPLADGFFGDPFAGLE